MQYSPYKFLSKKDFFSGIPNKDPLPHNVIDVSLTSLPSSSGLVKKDSKGNIKEISRDIKIAIDRVLNTNFSFEYWHLDNPRDVLDTVFWTIAGGSFIADFAMDTSKPRIFAWGLPMVKEAAYYSLERLKGRNPRQVPTAACLPPENVFDFIDLSKLPPITKGDIEHYFSAGPLGMRVFANKNVPKHLVNTKTNQVQFIISGHNSGYMRLVRLYIHLSKFPMMGITSGNYSSHGPKSRFNKGTHHTISKLMDNMGSLGIPILAGHINKNIDDTTFDLEKAYDLLNNSFIKMSVDDIHNFKDDLLPVSVTITELKKHPKGFPLFEVKRHGSLHYELLKEHITKKIKGDVILDEDISRLTISNY